MDEFRPTRSLGDKYERVAAVLEPKYDNMQIWHYKGGNCQSLEEELVMAHPPHDDIKDALANAISIAFPYAKAICLSVPCVLLYLFCIFTLNLVKE